MKPRKSWSTKWPSSPGACAAPASKDRGFVPQKQNRDCEGAAGFVPPSEQNPDCQGGVKLTAERCELPAHSGFISVHTKLPEPAHVMLHFLAVLAQSCVPYRCCTRPWIASSSFPASAHFPCALNSRYRCRCPLISFNVRIACTASGGGAAGAGAGPAVGSFRTGAAAPLSSWISC